jgi:hypothetical protein
MGHNDELAKKMEKIRQLVDAEEAARQAFVVNPTHGTALAVQSLKRQRDALRKTLPKIREAA